MLSLLGRRSFPTPGLCEKWLTNVPSDKWSTAFQPRSQLTAWLLILFCSPTLKACDAEAVHNTPICKMDSALRPRSGRGHSARHWSTASVHSRGMSKDTKQCCTRTMLTACSSIPFLPATTSNQSLISRQTGRNAQAAKATKANTTVCTIVFLVNADGL